jgi:arylsulfatase A-like enzyme/tetratricopeptide (TPR) repeat protein
VKRPAVLVVGGLLLLSACTKTGTPPAPAGTPVVLISIDTLRADHLPAYGYSGVATPAIDALRRDAILFDDASSPCPLTLPAHASILTGLVPPAHGVRNNLGYRLDGAAHPTIARWLKAHGYATGAAVSAFVLAGKTGLADSFDVYDDAIPQPVSAEAVSQYQRPGGETVRRALGWLDGVQAKPFFLFLHLYEPHSPYEPPEPFRSRYAALPYDGEIAAADAIVGGFVGELNRRGLYDRSIVVLLSDHGEGLGEHGEKEHGIFLYREALHVPLMIKLPGSARAGETVKEPVSLVDLVPTLGRLLGVPPPPEADGRPMLHGDVPLEAQRRLYAETFYPRIHLGWSPLRSVWDGRHDFIDSPKPELYDLASDPREARNVFSPEDPAARESKRLLERIGGAFAPPAAASPEDVKKLAALGYLTGVAPEGKGPLPVPREEIGAIGAIESAYRLAAEGRNEDAVAALRKILAHNPNLFDAQYKLADTLARLDRPADAADAYRRAIAMAPSIAGELSVGLGRACLRLQRWDEAEANAAIAMKEHPGPAHAILARAALGRGDLEAAEKEAAGARAVEGSEIDADLVLTEVLLRRGRVQEALAAAEDARRRRDAAGGPPVEGLEFAYGDALARLERRDEAEKAFREEIRLFPKNTEAYARLAIVLALEHRTLGEVRRLFETMAAANPGPESARLAAKTLESLGDHEAAAVWRRRAGA